LWDYKLSPKLEELKGKPSYINKRDKYIIYPGEEARGQKGLLPNLGRIPKLSNLLIFLAVVAAKG